jgi:hypothetical protein
MIEQGHFKELHQILKYIYEPDKFPDDMVGVKRGQFEDLNFGFDLQLDSDMFYIEGEKGGAA